MEPTGRKEISEAVLIGALSACMTQLITWGFEETKKRVADRKKQQDEAQQEASRLQSRISELEAQLAESKQAKKSGGNS